MDNCALLITYTILACLPSLLLGFGKIPEPEVMKKEIYCVGCEYTIKVLYKLIDQSDLAEDNLDVRVADALQRVCQDEHFEVSEISAPQLRKACEFLIEENGQMLEPLAVSHFSRSSPATYLDLSQQVCNDMSNACVGVPGEKRFPDELDSDLEFDSASQTFRVKHGRNIRIPRPMRSDDDL